jgi:hypothetical protein
MSIGATIRSAVSELGDRHVQQMLLLPLTLPISVRTFVRERPSLDEVKTELQQALETREQRFLDLVRDCVYCVPESPYKKLLDHAGCAFGDVASALDKSGLEETLKQLARAGVYLTPAEYKGRQDVKRGGLSFRVQAADLAPPRQSGATSGVIKSSGSTGRPSANVTSFEWWRLEALVTASFLDAHNLYTSRVAAYEPILGSMAGGIRFATIAARLGVPVDRCFVRPTPANNWLESLYFRLITHEIALAARWFGPGFAWPEMISAEHLDRVVRWVEKSRKEGRATCIRTVASNAVRIARVANEIGASLEGCTFIASGEPTTTAKRRAIESAGGAVAVVWGYAPIGTIAFGCAKPAYDDEMHLSRHNMALIEHPVPIEDAGGEDIHPLLFTTLYPSAAQLEINVSNGDQAVLSERNCGCPMHEAGFIQHVHNVGSFEKLTSEGLAFSIDELYDLLETALPDRFGGGAGDYQLVEEEGDGGTSYLSLLIDPGIGPIDDAAVLDFLTTALASGSRNKSFMTRVWQEAGTFRILRQVPVTSSRGKILPLRLAAKKENGYSRRNSRKR